MDKNNGKCLHDINFPQLSLAEKTEIKNLGCATTDLVISQTSSSRKQKYLRKVRNKNNNVKVKYRSEKYNPAI
jgi:hypothetical protein